MSNVGTDSYTLAMLDKINAPLNKVLDVVSKLDGQLSQLQASAGKTSAVLAGMAGGAIVSGIGLIGKAIGGLVDLMSKGVGVAESFIGAVINAARFRQQNIASLDLFVGKGKGDPTFNKLLAFGGVLPADERDVVRQGTSLISAGYSGNQFNAVNAALQDVGATRGEQYRANLELHFLRLKNEASPDARDVKMAAIDTGIGQQGVFKHLFAQKGITAPASLFQQEKLYDSLKKQGKITGNDVANAIVAGIQEKFDEGGPLGTAAKRLGTGTLSGLITNLEAAPERFLAQMKLEELPGVKSLMEFIKRLLVFFDHATPQGKQLSAILEKLINTLLRGLDRFGENELANFFQRGLGFAESLLGVIEKTWGFVEDLLTSNWGDLVDSGAEVLREVGRAIGEGVRQGLLGGSGPPKTGTQKLEDIKFGTGSNIGLHTVSSVRSANLAGILEHKGGALKIATPEDLAGAGGPVTLKSPAAKSEELPPGGATAQKGAAGDVTIHVGGIHLSGEPTEQQKHDMEEQLVTVFRRVGNRVGAQGAQ